MRSMLDAASCTDHCFGCRRVCALDEVAWREQAMSSRPLPDRNLASSRGHDWDSGSAFEAVQVRGTEAVNNHTGIIGHQPLSWASWPLCSACCRLSSLIYWLKSGDQQTYLMLAALAGGIIFTAISLKFYYKLSGERLKFGWKDLGIALVSTIAMRIVIILFIQHDASYQQQTANDVSLGQRLWD